MELKVWKLHPDGMRVEAADKTVKGTANTAATKWCRPYSQANSLGWYLYPPTDLDVLWKGSNKFEYRHISEYNDYDYHFVRNLIRAEDEVDPNKWSPPGGRTKFTWGDADEGVVQIWSGLILKTPPDWCLQIRSPINCELPHRLYNIGPICSIQEGVLETDWMQYDIWVNIQFHVRNKWVYFRRNQKLPLAQLIPIHRDSLSPGVVHESAVNRNTPEGEEVFKYWLNYNHQKYGKQGKQPLSKHDPSLTKDSTTYYRERKKALGCPFAHGSEPRLDEAVPVLEKDCPSGYDVTTRTED
jgi:hypothetical protein